VNADGRGDIQTGGAPVLDRDIEGIRTAAGGDRRGYDIIIAGIEKHNGGPDPASGRFMKADVDEDDLTGQERHG
jgi:hypothetical protein